MLQDAFTSTTVDPPEHIIKLLQPDPDNVVSLPLPGPRPFWHAAIAASLLAGMSFLAGQQWPGAALPERELPGATVVHAALESQRSSATDWIALDSGFQLRPVLSFTDKSGAYCREYEVADNRRNWRGVACRVRGSWRTQVLVALQSAPTGSGQYRAAGTEASTLVTQFIDQHIDGIPLGAEQESAHIRNGWR